MRKNIVLCEENSSLRKVTELILKENVGSIIVNRGEESIGIITANDLLRAVLKGLDFDTNAARDIMSHPIETCNSGQDLDEALKKFDQSGRSRLIVKKDDKVVGILKGSIARHSKRLYQFSQKTRSLPFRRG
jgi:CBS domain-containing protein